jgi:hypothetical protein
MQSIGFSDSPGTRAVLIATIVALLAAAGTPWLGLSGRLSG